jgi:uroporphyrinogen-III synthase
LELREALECRGATVYLLEAIRHDWGCAWEELARTFRQSDTYSHLVLTSRTAVRFFAEAIRHLSVPMAAWAAKRVAVVGPGTAAAARDAGLEPEWIASRGATDLARQLLESGSLEAGSTRVLLPQSAIARPELLDRLRQAGVRVDALALYRTVSIRPEAARPTLEAAFAPAPPDAALFASPSAFQAVVEATNERELTALRDQVCRIVTIGATTSTAVRERGLSVAAEATSPTIDGLVVATERALQRA